MTFTFQILIVTNFLNTINIMITFLIKNKIFVNNNIV